MSVASTRAAALRSAVILKATVDGLVLQLTEGDPVGSVASSIAVNAGAVIGSLGRVSEAAHVERLRTDTDYAARFAATEEP